MAQAEAGSVPQQGVLLRRAHELLDSIGQPVAEDLLLQHLFGVNEGMGRNAIWLTLLRKALSSSSLFEQTDEDRWALLAWRSTQKPLEDIEFVVVDTETTGLRPGHHRVIELAGIRMRAGEVIGTFQSLLNPGIRLPAFIVQFTGIKQEMVATAPKAHEVFLDFLHFIDGAVLVGHNVGFDIGFLSYEARLLGYDFPIDGLDTIPLARRFLPGLRRFKLDKVANHLKIPTANRHRALGDAQVTAAIFMKLLELAQQQGIQTLGHLRRRLQLPVAWSGDITQTTTTKQIDQMRADGKMSAQSGTLRPTGTLFLDPAWKRDFPARPGVYLMKDAYGQVIYVGKAKCLKDRLASYYNQPLGYTRKMDGLLQNVKEELVQKVFPIRTCTRSLPPLAKPSDPCLRLHLNRCPGPCRGEVDPAEYCKTIEEVCAFLGGEREDLLDRLRRQMLEASQQLNFERAAWLRDTIRSADEVLIGQRLITGAVEANNLVIVYPSAQEGHNELFLIRHGRLLEQRCIPHEPEAMKLSVQELLKLAASLGEPPSIVGQAEVDQINIISRWIHHHSNDRAFFPFQQALTDEDEARLLAQRIWVEADAVRSLPVDNSTDEEDNTL